MTLRGSHGLNLAGEGYKEGRAGVKGGAWGRGWTVVAGADEGGRVRGTE